MGNLPSFSLTSLILVGLFCSVLAWGGIELLLWLFSFVTISIG